MTDAEKISFMYGALKGARETLYEVMSEMGYSDEEIAEDETIAGIDAALSMAGVTISNDAPNETMP